MKKSDLKTGMVVELRNEDKYLVVNDSILNLDGWDKMSNSRKWPFLFRICFAQIKE